MGWNSWNGFRAKIDERIVVETAEAMVANGMRDRGYRYVVIDDGWMAPERDRTGDLVPDPTKFPRGIAAVADRVHALGLRFGIYTDAGTKTCQDLPASLGYEFRDARRFAEWGVDYVKVDWCHTEGMGPRTLYAKWALALASAGRPIVFSICEWGRSKPWEWAGTVGHLWRTCWDIQPKWPDIATILDRQAELHPFAGPDHWNDPDMLEVGNGTLTTTESRAHLALWAILAAPLMAGNDVRVMSDEVREILTAAEVVAIDQDPLGRQGRRVRSDDGVEVWARPLAGTRRFAVALLQRAGDPRAIRLGPEDLGLRRLGRARDAWERADLSLTDGGLVVPVPGHGAALVVVEGT